MSLIDIILQSNLLYRFTYVCIIVWCDIGNKAIGVGALQKLLNVSSKDCLHVGDQFATSIGNDYAARQVPKFFHNVIGGRDLSLIHNVITGFPDALGGGMLTILMNNYYSSRQ